MKILSFLSFVHGGGKIYQVVGRDVLRLADKGSDGGAKLRDRIFKFRSLCNRYQGTQLPDLLLLGNCLRGSMAESMQKFCRVIRVGILRDFAADEAVARPPS